MSFVPFDEVKEVIFHYFTAALLLIRCYHNSVVVMNFPFGRVQSEVK